jgi:CRISPR-associated protein Csd1
VDDNGGRGETRLSSGDYLTFEVNGQLLLLDEEVIRPYWRNIHGQLHADKDASAQLGMCSVTGEENVPIARTHEVKIQGIRNTGSGGAIVSFDKPAFRSYGFEKSYNAPVSTRAAKDYCNALTWLLSRKNHSLTIGELSVCFWARDAEEASDFFALMLDRPDPQSVRKFLQVPWAGIDPPLQQHDQFYSVALSGNSGRIVVRHWMQTTVEAARKNLQCWFEDLSITSYGNPQTGQDPMPPLALFRLACTSVRDKDGLQPDMLTQLYQAALGNSTPPLLFLKPILSRLQVDLSKFGDGILETPLSRKTLRAISDARQPIPPAGESRFALIKLILNRNNRNRKDGSLMIAPQVFETDDPAYNCGRLLAVLAEAQQKAHDYKLEGAGVAERYFGMACASPASVFPLLIRLNRHHLNKISKSDKYKSHERFLEESIQNILALFHPETGNQPPVFPRVLDLHAQGRFALGFYQQQAADDAARRSAKSNSNQPQSNA